jgi:hypothetical protein
LSNIKKMMKIKDLSPAILAALKNKRYDRIVEKHEGPETWDWQLPPSAERVQEMKEMYKNRKSRISTNEIRDFSVLY